MLAEVSDCVEVARNTLRDGYGFEEDLTTIEGVRLRNIAEECVRESKKIKKRSAFSVAFCYYSESVVRFLWEYNIDT